MFELLDHLEKQHGKRTVSCSYCEYKAEDNETVKAHFITKHENSALITVVANQQLLLEEAMEVFKQDIGAQTLIMKLQLPPYFRRIVMQ